MSEPLLEGSQGVTGDPEPNPERPLVCEICAAEGVHADFKLAANLAQHMKMKHGAAYEPPRPNAPRKRNRPRAKSVALHEDLAKGVKALAMLPLLRNPAALGRPEVVDIIESRADDFASAWVAVAEKDERVAAWLNSLLTGGVWVNAGMATLTFTYAVAVFSGFAPLHPAVTMVMPELAQFIVTETPAAPARPAGSNGAQGS